MTAPEISHDTAPGISRRADDPPEDPAIAVLLKGKSIEPGSKLCLFDEITAASSFYPPYTWNFGDGTLDQSSGKHMYKRAGRFTLSLKRLDGLVIASREIYVGSLSRPVEEAFSVIETAIENARRHPEAICDFAQSLYRLRKNTQMAIELIDSQERTAKFELKAFITYLCRQEQLPFRKIERISSDPNDGSIQTITLR